jgi:hypothetical protein
MTQFYPNSLGSYPVVSPYVAAIPKVLLVGDSAEWIDVPFTDVNGVGYDSGGYTLKYTLVGPSAPLVLVAVPNGSSWQTNLTTTQSAALLAGKYGWSAQLFATGVRVTLSTGELTLNPDLAAQIAPFDPRSTAEIALAAAEAALANLGTGGGVKEYTIGTRHMAFSRETLITEINYWRGKVQAEHFKAKGARARMIGIRFQRAN